MEKKDAEDSTSIWCISNDEPLPRSPKALAAQIRDLANARRRNARTHPQRCKCIGCQVRKYDEAHSGFSRRIA